MFSLKEHTAFKAMAVAVSFTFLMELVSPFTEDAQAAFQRRAANAPRDASSLQGIKLPFQFGEVTFVSEETSGPLIVHIQDAHCNYSAQRSIAGIIEYLDHERGIRLAALEGGKGKYDLSLFTDVKNPATRRTISDFFVREGLVNGAEFYAINNPGRVALFGIEDADFYMKDLGAYRDFLPLKEDTDEALGYLEKTLMSFKSKIYPPELIQLDAASAKYKKGDMEFKDYVSFLTRFAIERGVDLAPYSNLAALIKIMDDEKGIDFEKANRERNLLIDRLNRKLSQRDIEELVAKSYAFREKNMSREDYYAYLFGKAALCDIDLTGFPDLEKYSAYVMGYENLDRHALMKELDDLAKACFGVFLKGGDEEKLFAMDADLGILEKMFDISLVREDWDAYLADKTAFSARTFMDFFRETSGAYGIDLRADKNVLVLDGCREKMEKFYEYSFKRDDAFIKNIDEKLKETGDKAVVLVTGGFHTENLEDIFAKKGYSYVRIMPKIEKTDVENPYLKLLSGGKLDIETLLPRALKFLAERSNIAITSLFSELEPDGIRPATVQLIVQVMEAAASPRAGETVTSNSDYTVTISEALPGALAGSNQTVISINGARVLIDVASRISETAPPAAGGPAASEIFDPAMHAVGLGPTEGIIVSKILERYGSPARSIRLDGSKIRGLIENGLDEARKLDLQWNESIPDVEISGLDTGEFGIPLVGATGINTRIENKLPAIVQWKNGVLHIYVSTKVYDAMSHKALSSYSENNVLPDHNSQLVLMMAELVYHEYAGNVLYQKFVKENREAALSPHQYASRFSPAFVRSDIDTISLWHKGQIDDLVARGDIIQLQFLYLEKLGSTSQGAQRAYEDNFRNYIEKHFAEAFSNKLGSLERIGWNSDTGFGRAIGRELVERMQIHSDETGMPGGFDNRTSFGKAVQSLRSRYDLLTEMEKRHERWCRNSNRPNLWYQQPWYIRLLNLAANPFRQVARRGVPSGPSKPGDILARGRTVIFLLLIGVTALLLLNGMDVSSVVSHAMGFDVAANMVHNAPVQMAGMMFLVTNRSPGKQKDLPPQASDETEKLINRLDDTVNGLKNAGEDVNDKLLNMLKEIMRIDEKIREFIKSTLDHHDELVVIGESFDEKWLGHDLVGPFSKLNPFIAFGLSREKAFMEAISLHNLSPHHLSRDNENANDKVHAWRQSRDEYNKTAWSKKEIWETIFEPHPEEVEESPELAEIRNLLEKNELEKAENSIRVLLENHPEKVGESTAFLIRSFFKQQELEEAGTIPSYGYTGGKKERPPKDERDLISAFVEELYPDYAKADPKVTFNRLRAAFDQFKENEVMDILGDSLRAVEEGNKPGLTLSRRPSPAGMVYGIVLPALMILLAVPAHAAGSAGDVVAGGLALGHTIMQIGGAVMAGAAVLVILYFRYSALRADPGIARNTPYTSFIQWILNGFKWNKVPAISLRGGGRAAAAQLRPAVPPYGDPSRSLSKDELDRMGVKITTSLIGKLYTSPDTRDDTTLARDVRVVRSYDGTLIFAAPDGGPLYDRSGNVVGPIRILGDEEIDTQRVNEFIENAKNEIRNAVGFRRADEDGFHGADEAITNRILNILEKKINIIAGNPHSIDGTASGDDIYLTMDVVSDPVSFLHELGESLKAEIEKETGVNAHTFMRGAGQDAREAYKALTSDLSREGKDVAAIRADELITLLNAKMREMEGITRVLTGAEEALIRYNNSLRGTRYSGSLIDGLQRKILGAAADEAFTGKRAAALRAGTKPVVRAWYSTVLAGGGAANLDAMIGGYNEFRVEDLTEERMAQIRLAAVTALSRNDMPLGTMSGNEAQDYADRLPPVRLHILSSGTLGIPMFEGANRMRDQVPAVGEVRDGIIHIYLTSRLYDSHISRATPLDTLMLAELVDYINMRSSNNLSANDALRRASRFTDGKGIRPLDRAVLDQMAAEGDIVAILMPFGGIGIPAGLAQYLNGTFVTALMNRVVNSKASPEEIADSIARDLSDRRLEENQERLRGIVQALVDRMKNEVVVYQSRHTEELTRRGEQTEGMMIRENEGVGVKINAVAEIIARRFGVSTGITAAPAVSEPGIFERLSTGAQGVALVLIRAWPVFAVIGLAMAGWVTGANFDIASPSSPMVYASIFAFAGALAFLVSLGVTWVKKGFSASMEIARGNQTYDKALARRREEQGEAARRAAEEMERRRREREIEEARQREAEKNAGRVIEILAKMKIENERYAVIGQRMGEIEATLVGIESNVLAMMASSNAPDVAQEGTDDVVLRGIANVEAQLNEVDAEIAAAAAGRQGIARLDELTARANLLRERASAARRNAVNAVGSAKKAAGLAETFETVSYARKTLRGQVDVILSRLSDMGVSISDGDKARLEELIDDAGLTETQLTTMVDLAGSSAMDRAINAKMITNADDVAGLLREGITPKELDDRIEFEAKKAELGKTLRDAADARAAGTEEAGEVVTGQTTVAPLEGTAAELGNNLRDIAGAKKRLSDTTEGILSRMAGHSVSLAASSPELQELISQADMGQLERMIKVVSSPAVGRAIADGRIKDANDVARVLRGEVTPEDLDTAMANREAFASFDARLGGVETAAREVLSQEAGDIASIINGISARLRALRREIEAVITTLTQEATIARFNGLLERVTAVEAGITAVREAALEASPGEVASRAPRELGRAAAGQLDEMGAQWRLAGQVLGGQPGQLALPPGRQNVEQPVGIGELVAHSGLGPMQGTVTVDESDGSIRVDPNMATPLSLTEAGGREDLDKMLTDMIASLRLESMRDLTNGEEAMFNIAIDPGLAGINEGDLAGFYRQNIQIRRLLDELVRTVQLGNITINFFVDTEEGRAKLRDRINGQVEKWNSARTAEAKKTGKTPVVIEGDDIKRRVITFSFSKKDDRYADEIDKLSFTVHMDDSMREENVSAIPTPITACFSAGVRILNVFELTRPDRVSPAEESAIAASERRAAEAILGLSGNVNFSGPELEKLFNAIHEKGLINLSGLIYVTIRPVNWGEVIEFHKAELEVLQSL